MVILTDKTELFIDEFIIDKSDNTFIRQNRPLRCESVLFCDRDYESPYGSLGGNVIDTGDEIRLYYRGYPINDTDGDYDNKQVCCAAVSRDGIHFSKPQYDLIEYNDSKANNIVFKGTLAHNFSPFIDTNPLCKQEEKFKAICGLKKVGLHLFTSPDGIHWKPFENNPLPITGCFDTQNVAFYDNIAGCYRIYFRYHVGPTGRFDSFNGFRAIASTTTYDFIHFSPSIGNIYDRDMGVEHLYTNATIPCPGAEHIYLSFPMRFANKRKKVDEHSDIGISDGLIMTSRNGVQWSRILEDPWIQPGFGDEEWTQRSHITGPGIIERDNEFYFYVTEHYCHKTCHIQRFSLPKHRFASLAAKRTPGEAESKAFIADNDKMFINYSTSAYGSVSFAITDRDKNPISGYGYEECGEIYGNELIKEVKWGNKDFSALRNKVLRMKIRLHEADLYSIGFKNSL